MELYIIIAACVLAAIGIIVGFILGYTRLSCWGGSVVGATLVGFIVARAGFVPESDWYGVIMLGVAGGSLLVFTALCQLVRRYISRAVKRAEKLSYYKQYDAMEANDERILIALDKKDKKGYRRNARRTFRMGRGPWGVVDRIFGAVTLTLNIFAAIVIVGALALVVIDCAQITVVQDALAGIYENEFWQGDGSSLAIDMLVVTLMCMCVRAGYNNGILSALTALLIIGLIGGAGYLAYHIVFVAKLLDGASQGVYDSLLANLLVNVQTNLDGMGLDALTLGRIIMTAVAFLVLLIPTIIISVFIPRAVDSLRSFKTVTAVDGAFGAIVLTAVVFGILLFLGAVLWQVSDLDAFKVFNKYMENTSVANALYGENIIGKLDFITNLPLRDWVGLS